MDEPLGWSTYDLQNMSMDEYGRVRTKFDTENATDDWVPNLDHPDNQPKPQEPEFKLDSF